MVSLLVEYLLRMKKMTKQNFAEKLGVSCSQVTKLLSGKENLSLKTISRMEEVLEMDLINIPNIENSRLTKINVEESLCENTTKLSYGKPTSTCRTVPMTPVWTQSSKVKIAN